MAEPVLRGDRLGHRFRGGPWLWRDLDVTMVRGEVLAVLGPNGRGKSTLLRALAGLLRPEEGTIEVCVPLTYVPQSYAPAFGFTVLDLVLAGRSRRVRLFGQPAAGDEAAALRALDQVGMAWAADRAFPSLSGGERQLVALARALAADAELIILDEPLAALDLKHQRDMLLALKALAAPGRHSLILTTHDPNHAAAIADRVLLLMDAGHHRQGTAEVVLTPAHLTTAFDVEVRRIGSPDHIMQEAWFVT